MSALSLQRFKEWAAQLTTDIAKPWPYEHCHRCGAPLVDLNHSVRHMQGHYPQLWPALKGVGKEKP